MSHANTEMQWSSWVARLSWVLAAKSQPEDRPIAQDGAGRASARGSETWFDTFEFNPRF